MPLRLPLLSLPLFLLLLLLLLFSASANAVAADDELLIGAAASLQDAMQEVAAGFRNQAKGPPVKIAFSFGASSELVKQATHLAPLDLVLSADEANMDKLDKLGLLTPGSRVDLVSNQVVLVAARQGPGASVKSLADLSLPQIKRIALCAPAVPIGAYGQAWLARHHLEASLAPKLVQAPNVRAALALVASGGADVGFVYATDVAIEPKVAVVLTAGPSEGLVIRYPGAVLKASRHQALAQSFLAYLRTPPAATVFRAHGFVPVQP